MIRRIYRIDGLDHISDLEDASDEEIDALLAGLEQQINDILHDIGVSLNITYSIDNDEVFCRVSLANAQEQLNKITEAYRRGYNDNGWTWRTPQSLADEAELNIEDVNNILESNTNLFERSRNGRMYRYLELEQVNDNNE
mgnify:CR=1 FL=1